MEPLSTYPEAGAEFAASAIAEIVRRGAPVGASATARDRWGRVVGPTRWRTVNGRETTIEEIMLAEGAARVAPSGRNFEFLERCISIERAARGAKIGLWRLDAWRIRDAAKAERSFGFQIYSGVVRQVGEFDRRMFFNFGDDFRTDFTATAARGAFSRWRGRPALESFGNARVEVRGRVLSINGPSIELKHEMQMLRIDP